jgi:hypothetical protein
VIRPLATAAEHWQPAPQRPAIGHDEVQVWRTEVPAAETARTAGRALRGAVLARLRGDPRALELNLTHSGELALLAVGRERRVGVDVERLRPRLDVDGVGRLALSAAELREVAAAPDAASARAAFFARWTRKEAYLKATGEGLPGRLRGWSVVPAEGEGLYMPLRPEDPTAREWRIRSLALGDGYAGAVAHEGEARLSCFHLGPAMAASWAVAELADSHYFDAERRLHLLI